MPAATLDQLHRLRELQRRAAAGQRTALLPHQIPPEGAWRGWVLLAGRDAGKTYAGTRWLASECESAPLRARIIAPTFGDGVASCVEGPSGVLHHSRTASWHPSEPGGACLKWPNGSVCWVLGTPTLRDVDRLRAITNIDRDMFEEAAANPMLAKAVAQARLSRRRKGARWIATTTPRFIPTIRGWIEDDRIPVSSGTSHDNPHGDPEWQAELEDEYAGTRLYRQEVLGELVKDVEGALWTYDALDRSRVQTPAALVRTVVGVDPANTTGTTGIVVVGLGIDGHIYILADVSKSAHPSEWASTVAAVALEWDAQIVAESDSGGLMVEQTLRSTGTDAPVHVVTARGSGRKHAKGPKAARAEPVAVLWETEPAKAHIVGALPKLEDQLCSWDGTGKSPDRMDAMVHAVAWLRGTAKVKVQPLVSIDVT